MWKEVVQKIMWLDVIHLLVVKLNLMSAGTNRHKYMMGLHLMYVKNRIGDMNNNGVYEILAGELGGKRI